ncbi:MAG: helix-turn-helix transcriptional regulator [Verrucomicrobiota bacterium]
MQEKNSTLLKDFSERLNMALMSAGMSRGALAKRCGVSASTISRWRGSHLPSPVILTTVSEVLGVRREWLAAGLEPMKADSAILRDEAADYPATPRGRLSAQQQMMSAMITIIAEVMDDKRPLTDLEQVHALLDLVHPMPAKEDPTP